MSTQQRANIVLRELKKLYPNPEVALQYSSVLELLIAVILSAQCTDKKVNDVTKDLFAKYTTLEDYASAPVSDFEQDIKSIGLYKAKAKNIVAAAQQITQEFKGAVPQTMEELIRLPGVGRKTANVVLGVGFGIADGMAVDTHVGRLSKKFGLTTHTDPKKIEQDLIKLFPQDEWIALTHRMIWYGREHSSARHKAEDDIISLALKETR